MKNKGIKTRKMNSEFFGASGSEFQPSNSDSESDTSTHSVVHVRTNTLGVSERATSDTEMLSDTETLCNSEDEKEARFIKIVQYIDKVYGDPLCKEDHNLLNLNKKYLSNPNFSIENYYSSQKSLNNTQLDRFIGCMKSGSTESAKLWRKHFSDAIEQEKDLRECVREKCACEALFLHLEALVANQKGKKLYKRSFYKREARLMMGVEEARVISTLTDSIIKNNVAHRMVAHYNSISKLLIKEYEQHLPNHSHVVEIQKTLNKLGVLEEQRICHSEKCFSAAQVQAIRMILVSEIAFTVKQECLNTLDLRYLDLLVNNMEVIYLGLSSCPPSEDSVLNDYLQNVILRDGNLRKVNIDKKVCVAKEIDSTIKEKLDSFLRDVIAIGDAKRFRR